MQAIQATVIAQQSYNTRIASTTTIEAPAVTRLPGCEVKRRA